MTTDLPLVVVTGAPVWLGEIETLVAGDYRLAQYRQRSGGYVARLADDRAALIVVDGDDAEWRFWAVTPRTSPATRRIPVLVVAADRNRHGEALLAGADLALAPAELGAQLRALLADYARVPDPARMAELDCQCGETLPPLALAGLEQFNAGAYYPQHDLFEEQWVNTPGPVRDLYRAILQVGVAYYQIERGNHRGALKMLLRSVQWLAILPDVCQGVDVRQLREDSYRVRAELERMDPADIARFDRSLLKPVKRV